MWKAQAGREKGKGVGTGGGAVGGQEKALHGVLFWRQNIEERQAERGREHGWSGVGGEKVLAKAPREVVGVKHQGGGF